MSSGLGQRPFQFLHFLLLTDAFRFRSIQLVEFLLAVAVLQFFGFLLFFSDGTDGGKGILVPETARHLIHLVSGFLRVGLRQLRIDAVGGNRLLGIFAAPECLHHEVHQRTQGNEHHQREDVLGLFEIDFSNHGWSLF